MDNRTIDEIRRNEDRLINEIELLEKENRSLKKQLEEKENQQKEFIEWLDNLIVSDLGVFTEVKVCDVLSKYKEIIGEKDE